MDIPTAIADGIVRTSAWPGRTEEEILEEVVARIKRILAKIESRDQQ
jgi:hypothetical protein